MGHRTTDTNIEPKPKKSRKAAPPAVEPRLVVQEGRHYHVEVESYFYTDPTATGPVRSFVLADSMGQTSRHVGRGLDARSMLAALAAVPPWPNYPEETSRGDRTVWDDDGNIVGLVLNPFGDPRWFGGKPLALHVVADDRGTRIERVEPDPSIKLPKDDKLNV